MTNSPAPKPGSSMSIELRWQILVPWLALTTVLLTATRADPDLWGHVRFGLDWMQTHTLPSSDPYSFTQDKPWINHEWASEALSAAAFTVGGAAGLVLMKAAAMAATVAVLWRRLTGSTPLVKAVVSTLAVTAALPLSGTVRPQIWSAVALVLLTLLLDGRPPSFRRIASGAVLFAVWANLHGGWITGAAGTWTLRSGARAARAAARLALAGAPACLPRRYLCQSLWHRPLALPRYHRPQYCDLTSPSGLRSV